MFSLIRTSEEEKIRNLILQKNYDIVLYVIYNLICFCMTEEESSCDVKVSK